MVNIRNRLKYGALILSVMLLVSQSAPAWFTSTELWEHLSISRVNQVDVEATDEGTADEAGTVKLPVTIRAQAEPSDTYDVPLEQLKMQYTTDEPGTGQTWHDLEKAYDLPGMNNVDTITTLKSGRDQTFFGQHQLTEEMVGLGTTVYIRLYVANESAGFENAPLGADTGPEGDNGWKDGWVVELTTDTNKRPTFGPGSFGF